jgi:hypothetical protein
MVNHRKTAGITLIEVNLAMGVLLFGIISVASLFPAGLQLAEYGFRSSDATLIAAMAKSQLELLTYSKHFKFPAPVSEEGREGRLAESAPTSLKAPFRALRCKQLRSEAPMDWSGGAWSSKYLLLTSGAEAGKVFLIVGNSVSTLEVRDNLAGTGLRANDSFRIIYNKGGTKCIPERFLEVGERIPTINGLAIDQLASATGSQGQLLNNPAFESASTLAGKDWCRYSYAILLDGPKQGSPNLFRAYVLIYKDFDPGLGMQWWQNRSPIEYYPFFYRKPSALPK